MSKSNMTKEERRIAEEVLSLNTMHGYAAAMGVLPDSLEYTILCRTWERAYWLGKERGLEIGFEHARNIIAKQFTVLATKNGVKQ